MPYSYDALVLKNSSVLVQAMLAGCAFVLLPSLMAVAWIAYAEQQGLLLHADPYMSVIAVAGISAAYCLDRLIDPDSRLQQVYAAGFGVCLRLLFVGAVMCAGWFWYLSAFQNVLGLAVCLMWACGHAFAKSVPGAKTVCVTLAWLTACFAVPLSQPLLQVGGQQIYHVGVWLTLFAIACVMCDFKDEIRDRQTHVRSLVVLLGAARCRKILYLLLSMTAVCAGLWAFWALFILALLLCALLSQQRVLADPILAPLLVDACLVFSAVCGVFAVY